MTLDNELVEVALFPIPNVVAFPGTVVPLHVFEPRYRRLVHDCVEDQRLLAVSNTRKTISEPRQGQTVEEALGSNQATYQPEEIFSAGQCEIVNTLPDGRLLVQITMTERLALVEEIQSLPYRIVACARVTDDADASNGTEELRRLLGAKLTALARRQNPEFSALEDSVWTSLDAGEFSFKIFQFLQLDPGTMQSILESRSARDRLAMTWDVLRRA